MGWLLARSMVLTLKIVEGLAWAVALFLLVALGGFALSYTVMNLVMGDRL